MPEAAVNEDSHTGTRKDDVRSSGGRLRMEAIAEPGSPQETTKDPLRSRVAPANSGHLLGAVQAHRVNSSFPP